MTQCHKSFEDSLLHGGGRPFFSELARRLEVSESKISFITVRTKEEQQRRDDDPIR